MSRSLVVSTECPNCGASLDFGEGSNTVQCGHCRTRLLVTGRKQVLSYAISPKVDEKEAIRRIRLARRENESLPRVVKAQLYFMPYYRLTGHDFLWQSAALSSESKREEDPDLNRTPIVAWETADGSRSDFLFPTLSILDSIVSPLIEAGAQLLKKIIGSAEAVEKSSPAKTPPQAIPLPVPLRRNPSDGGGEEQAVFRDRYVEKNFIASDRNGILPYSLGVRPAVLRLELFREALLKEKGRVIRPMIPERDALAHGMKAADSKNILYRKVIGQVLSMIYFPFWVVEMEQKGESTLQIVDGVSEEVVQTDAPLSLYDLLESAPSSQPDVAGFRPLTCPNCGWDLPAKSEDVVFFCESCRKAWQVRGQYLYETDYVIADAGRSDLPVTYLPFWVLAAATPKAETKNGIGKETEIGAGRPARYFIPAFRYRRLKMLSDLAGILFKKQPFYSISEDRTPPLRGCYYDQEDAVALAQFIRAGSDKKSLEKAESEQNHFPITDATLTWLPFRKKGGGLVDPFTGFSLPENLLL